MLNRICFVLFWFFVSIVFLCLSIKLMFALDQVYHFLPLK